MWWCFAVLGEVGYTDEIWFIVFFFFMFILRHLLEHYKQKVTKILL